MTGEVAEGMVDGPEEGTPMLRPVLSIFSPADGSALKKSSSDECILLTDVPPSRDKLFSALGSC